MDFMTVVRLARKWWYLVLPMFFVTIGLALLVAQSVPVTYEATGTVLFEPPATAETANGANGSTATTFVQRFPDAGSEEVFASRVIETVMNDSTTKEALHSQGAGDYTVKQQTAENQEALPLLQITADSSTADGALKTLKLVGDTMVASLQQQQVASKVDATQLITVRPLLADTRAATLYGGRYRAGIAVAALGLAATFSMPFLMESMSRGRRRPSREWTGEVNREPPRVRPRTEVRETVRAGD
ncbi:MAG TPA: hypothetical protein VGJ03_05165 [Acidimicrobiales bacterium]